MCLWPEKIGVLNVYITQLGFLFTKLINILLVQYFVSIRCLSCTLYQNGVQCSSHRHDDPVITFLL